MSQSGKVLLWNLQKMKSLTDLYLSFKYSPRILEINRYDYCVYGTKQRSFASGSYQALEGEWRKIFTIYKN